MNAEAIFDRLAELGIDPDTVAAELRRRKGEKPSRGQYMREYMRRYRARHKPKPT